MVELGNNNINIYNGYLSAYAIPDRLSSPISNINVLKTNGALILFFDRESIINSEKFSKIFDLNTCFYIAFPTGQISNNIVLPHNMGPLPQFSSICYQLAPFLNTTTSIDPTINSTLAYNDTTYTTFNFDSTPVFNTTTIVPLNNNEQPVIKELFFSIKLRILENYTDAYNNSKSNEFRDLSNRINKYIKDSCDYNGLFGFKGIKVISLNFGSVIADLQSFFISSQPLIEKDIVNAINNGSNGTSLLTIDPTFTYVVEQMKEFTTPSTPVPTSESVTNTTTITTTQLFNSTTTTPVLNTTTVVLSNTSFSISLRILEDFTDDYRNPNSRKYKTLTFNIKKYIKVASESGGIDGYSDTKIKSLQPGSVIANVESLFSSSQPISQDALLTAIKAGSSDILPVDPTFTTVLRVDTITTTIVPSTTSSETPNLSTTAPATTAPATTAPATTAPAKTTTTTASDSRGVPVAAIVVPIVVAVVLLIVVAIVGFCLYKKFKKKKTYGLVRPTTNNTARNINPDVHEIEKENIVLNDAKLIKSAVFDETKPNANSNNAENVSEHTSFGTPRSANKTQNRETMNSYSSINENNSIQPPKYTTEDISRFSYSSFNDNNSTLPKENPPTTNAPSAKGEIGDNQSDNRKSIAIKEQDFEMIETRNSDENISIQSNQNQNENENQNKNENKNENENEKKE